jgi:hypothetical protein
MKNTELLSYDIDKIKIDIININYLKNDIKIKQTTFSF